MKLEQSFEVAAPLERVWETLVDIERVAPCLPGAEITEVGDDGTYRGSFTVKLGPTTAAYRGQLSMEEVDDSAHRSVMRASGQDKRGQGSAKATIVSSLHSEPESTRVDVETDFTITGRLARFGRGGMIKDISNRLLKDFAECLQARIEADGSPAQGTPSGGSAAAAESDPPAASAAPGESPPSPAPAPAGRSAAASSAATSAPRPAAKPIGGFSLFFRALLDRLRRLLGRSG